MKLNWEKLLEEKVANHLKGYTASHDFYHLLRVKESALKIAEEVGADRDILVAGALLHDIGYKGNENDDQNHAVHGVEIAKKWLLEIDFLENKIDKVLEVVRLHDNFQLADDYEVSIVREVHIIQDADRIDVLGAIGIARMAYYYGEKGFPIYSPEPVPATNKLWLNHSLLNQLERDPLPKWENMNFPISKKISRKKYEIIKKFLSDLKEEINDMLGDI